MQHGRLLAWVQLPKATTEQGVKALEVFELWLFPQARRNVEARQARGQRALSLRVSLLLTVSGNKSARWEQPIYFCISKAITRACRSPSLPGLPPLQRITDVLAVGLLQLLPATVPW